MSDTICCLAVILRYSMSSSIALAVFRSLGFSKIKSVSWCFKDFVNSSRNAFSSLSFCLISGVFYKLLFRKKPKADDNTVSSTDTSAISILSIFLPTLLPNLSCEDCLAFFKSDTGRANYLS